jgi:hypothetical protein
LNTSGSGTLGVAMNNSPVTNWFVLSDYDEHVGGMQASRETKAGWRALAAHLARKHGGGHRGNVSSLAIDR